VGLNANEDAHRFDSEDTRVKRAVDFLKAHVAVADAREAEMVAREVDEAVKDWTARRAAAQQVGHELSYSPRNSEERLMRQFDQNGQGWPVMNSMRTVDRVVKVRANGERLV
jgi:hypothetical protein